MLQKRDHTDLMDNQTANIKKTKGKINEQDNNKNYSQSKK
jgi:hypothetical protein